MTTNPDVEGARLVFSFIRSAPEEDAWGVFLDVIKATIEQTQDDAKDKIQKLEDELEFFKS